MVDNINARIRAWWMMAAGLRARGDDRADRDPSCCSALISLLALREFVTLAPTTAGDHRALFWCFFIVTPLQYFLIWIEWYGLFSILIPVYVVHLPGHPDGARRQTRPRFLERTATYQWGLMICVYFVSYVPALLMLRIPGYERADAGADVLSRARGAVQRRAAVRLGKDRSAGGRVAPSISPNKTWEGLLGGMSVRHRHRHRDLVGDAVLARPRPALMALVVTVMGFAGGLIMSAIKRDRGVKDYGTLIEGHGGMLDRIDSLCFAAPVFFHLTRYFYVP